MELWGSTRLGPHRRPVIVHHHHHQLFKTVSMQHPPMNGRLETILHPPMIVEVIHLHHPLVLIPIPIPIRLVVVDEVETTTLNNAFYYGGGN